MEGSWELGAMSYELPLGYELEARRWRLGVITSRLALTSS